MLPSKLHSIARSAAFLLISLLLAITWGFSSAGKILAGGVPEWFTSTFANTFLAKFPGLWISFYSITLLELLAALAAVGSLFSFEFLLRRPPFLLVASIILSLGIFAQLSVGKYLLSDFNGTHQLYTYFAGTLIFLAYITHHTPATQPSK